MANDSVINDETRRLIGVESDPARYEIEKESIRRWAEAIGDPNPLYHDENFARRNGHNSLPAPLGFVGNYLFPVTGPHPWPKLFQNGLFVQTGNEYEMLGAVHAGDVLTARTKVVDLREREDKSGTGSVVLQTSETNFRNQRGEIVVVERTYGIIYTRRREQGY